MLKCPARKLTGDTRLISGSVGKPKDGDPRACYVMLTIDETARPGSPEGIRVEHIRLAYDVEKASRAVSESVLPDAYAEALHTGR